MRVRMTDVDKYDDCLYQFTKYFWDVIVKDEYVDNFHIKEICCQLQQWVRSLLRREHKEEDMIVNISPGETKSLICSVMFPAWLWTIDPTLRLITGSYNEKLGLDLAVKSKDVISSNKYTKLFGKKFKIRLDADSKAHFKNDKGGERLVVTVGAMVTGFHAHLKILDDPNSPFEVLNPDIYEKDSLWYDTSFYNRNVDDKITLELFVQQRCGTNDMTGHLLTKKSRKFRHLILPASIDFEISPKHLIAKYTNGVMNPHRKPLDRLLQIQEDMDEFSYNSQYGQSPKAKSTKLAESEWFEVIEELPDDFWSQPVLYFVDSSFKKGKENDPIGIMPVVIYNFDCYIIEFVKGRFNYLEQKELIVSTVERYSGLIANIELYIEEASSGYALIDDLSASMPFTVTAVPKTNETKYAEFSVTLPLLRAKRYKLLSEAYSGSKWHSNFLDIVTKFPLVKHDEEIDCINMVKKEVFDKMGTNNKKGNTHERDFRLIE